MPLLQVLLILAVLAAVAAVAAGRGDRLRQVTPERPDLSLPEGPIGAAEVERVRFSLAVRGYRQDEVDAALDRLAGELEARDSRIAELQAALEAPPGGVDEGELRPADHAVRAADGAQVGTEPALPPAAEEWTGAVDVAPVGSAEVERHG